MGNTMNINLARKWRSKQFDEIVGQPLAVRLLKNSLYRNMIFPVYLLSGTRGTGKTSTARIFAAALNCRMLSEFQKNPQGHVLPCLVCDSCKAMQLMAHPDVIEIDAASHTGVDNVRQIIEAASFIPVLGGKKIYLIDEAHMLSKAAFNAFLKILEEPPQTVVFMLVTTDPHKIIPTVLSRCFQVFFDPIKPADVVRHLTFICEQEGITAEPEALMLIAQETEGCMRDALNLLERLRALPDLERAGVPSSITRETVLTVLGSIDDDRIGQLLLTLASQDSSALLERWQELEMHRFNPSSVWEKLVETLRRSLWLKHAVAPDEMPIPDVLQKFVEAASLDRMMSMLELCYDHELVFAKTSAPGTLLELLLLKMNTPGNTSAPHMKEAPMVMPAHVEKVSSSRTSAQGVPKSAAVSQTQTVKAQAPVVAQKVSESSDSPSEPVLKAVPSLASESAHGGVWGNCLRELENIQDPLVVSIFKQCAQHVYHDERNVLELTFSKDLVFFQDWLGNTEKVWKPIIEKFYGAGVMLSPKFDGVSVKQRPVVTGPIRPATQPMVPQTSSEVQKAPQRTAPAAAGAQRPPAQTFAKPPQRAKPQEPQGKVVSPDGLKIGSLVAEAFPGKLLAADSSKEGL